MAEEVQTETVVEKPSLMDTVRAAVTEHAGDDNGGQRAVPEGNPPPEAPTTDEAKEARARDEQGRFAKGEKERPTLTLKEKPAAGGPQTAKAGATPQLATPAVPPASEKPAVVAPPAWFKGEGRINWNKLPDPVRSELSTFVGGLEAERAEVAPLKEMIDANRQTLVREAGSVQEGIRQLLSFHQLSLEKPLDLIQHIARSRGIDLRAAFAGQPVPQAGTPQAPDINSLVAQAVQQHLQPFQQQAEQQQLNHHLQTVQTFANDPAHPYFNDVADKMEALLKAGIATDLQNAYDQATRLDTTISGQLEQQRQKEAEEQRKAEAAKARQAAAASVRGSPVTGADRQTSGKTPTVQEAARAAFAEHAGT